MFESGAGSDRIGQLPIQIALVAQSIVQGENPRLRVWAGLELSEAVLKWVFAVAAGAIYETKGALTPALSRSVANSIRIPTFGAWRDMTAVAAAELQRERKKDGFGIEFADFFGKHEGRGKESSVWTKLKDIRNNVIHGGGLTEAAARKVWSAMDRDLEKLVLDLAAIHANYDVVAAFSGRHLRLLGISPEVIADAMQPSIDGAWLVRRDGLRCDLRPLLTYEPVREFWEIDHIRPADDAHSPPVPQWYFKLEKGQLFYTPIGVDDFISVNRHTESFDRVFSGVADRSAQTILARQYADAQQKHVASFTGRDKEVASVLDWLADKTPHGNVVGLIVGGPGLGKSALLAMCASRYRTHLDDIATLSRRSVYHAFSADNPQNDRRMFLLNIRQQLQRWLGRRTEGSIDLGTPEADLDGVKALLQQALGRGTSHHLALFVDGLDEVRTFDPTFNDLLLDLIRPGVTIVAATRAEEWLKPLEASERIERVRFRGGRADLPGMTNQEIRALLLERLGKRARDIVALDADAEDGTAAENPYIARVVERAAGKPLYVELLIADILENGARIDLDARLPASVEGFYEKLLTRQGISDTKAHLAIILCLLALVPEPVDEDWLAEMLALSPGPVRRSGRPRDWVRSAVGQGEVFFAHSTIADGRSGLALYHSELKRYVLGETGHGAIRLQWAFGMARWLLATAAAQESSRTDAAVVAHFLRNGAEYLLAHADAVAPPPLAVAAARHVKASYFRADALPAIFEAWDRNHEGFLRSCARVFQAYQAASGAEAVDDILREILQYIFGHPDHRISASVVHSVYGYSPASRSLYEGLLRLAISDDHFVDGPKGKGLGLARVSWIIRAGGAARRAGDLARADRHLAAADHLLATIESVPRTDLDRELSALRYEQGYVAYCRSDSAAADAAFGEATTAAEHAEDWVGAHIGRSVRYRVAFIMALARGEDASSTMNRYEAYLRSAIVKFEKMAPAAGQDEARLNAKRWVMNCKGDLFEIAWHARRPDEALVRYKDYLDDPWIRKAEAEVFDVMHERIAPRVAQLRGQTERAVDLYRLFLQPISDGRSKDARREAIAEHYLEFGELLIRLEQAGAAKEVLSWGLLTSDDHANAIWKPRISRLLSTLRA